MATVYDTIIGAIREVVQHKELGTMTPETKLFEELNLDSISIIELLVNLEGKIEGFEANPEEMEPENFETIGALSEHILHFVERSRL